MLLFSWLIYRTQTAISESVTTWLVFKSVPSWRLLSFPMQATFAAIVTAILTAIPLRKIVGERSPEAAIIAALPYALAFAAHTVLNMSRWRARPLADAILLYYAVIPVLIIGETSSLLTRFPFRTDNNLAYRRLRAHGVALLTGKANAGVALFAFYGGALALTAWAIDSRHLLNDSAVGLTLYAAVFPAIAFLLTLAALATWRSLARAGRRHVVIDNLATFGRLTIAATAGGIALWGFFVEAPLSGTTLADAMQLMPGPPWSIKPGRSSDVLLVSGEFQRGVSVALAAALAHYPAVRRLELDSPGGYLDEGFAMAKLVEKHALATYVRHTCESACTIVFIAGRKRTMAAGAKLGFHRGHSDVWYGYARDGDYGVVEYLKSKGVSKEFIHKQAQVPYEDMWYPSMEELLAARILSAPPSK